MSTLVINSSRSWGKRSGYRKWRETQMRERSKWEAKMTEARRRQIEDGRMTEVQAWAYVKGISYTDAIRWIITPASGWEKGVNR